MAKLDQAIRKYCAYMREIKQRIEVIDRVLEGITKESSVTGFTETDIELIYLQLRHCLELIMFASLVAHDTYGHELSKKLLNKEYSATKLLKFIKIKNPNYYPEPKTNEYKDAEGMWRRESLQEGYLTEEEFCKLYDRTCGHILHAQRKPKFDDNQA